MTLQPAQLESFVALGRASPLWVLEWIRWWLSGTGQHGEASEQPLRLKLVLFNIGKDSLELPAPGHQSRVDQIIPEFALIFGLADPRFGGWAFCWGGGIARLFGDRIPAQDLLSHVTGEHAEEVLDIDDAFATNREVDVIVVESKLVNFDPKMSL